MEVEAEKLVNNVDDNKFEAVEADPLETDIKTKQYTTVQASSESPANPSVDSSTDTLIPNNDSLVSVVNGEKEMYVLEKATGLWGREGGEGYDRIKYS